MQANLVRLHFMVCRLTNPAAYPAGLFVYRDAIVGELPTALRRTDGIRQFAYAKVFSPLDFGRRP